MSDKRAIGSVNQLAGKAFGDFLAPQSLCIHQRKAPSRDLGR